MAMTGAPTATLVNGEDLQMRRRWARASALATTAYHPDRARALLAMRMDSTTAASALSARSQRSCSRSQWPVCAISMQCTNAQAPGTEDEILGPEVEGGRVGKVQHSSFTFVWGVFRVGTAERKSTVPPMCGRQSSRFHAMIRGPSVASAVTRDAL